MSSSLPEEEATRIAKKHLNADTLKTRNQDSLDFHNVAAWSIKAALEEAYQLGRQAYQSKEN